VTRILALMKYSKLAASTRQRLLQYEPYLNAHGIEVEMAPLFGDDYITALSRGRKASVFSIAKAYAGRVRDILRSRCCDLLWVHHEIFPYLPGRFDEMISLFGKPIVYDFDDATFHKYDSHVNPAIRKLLGNKLAPLLRRATACSCGNAYLKAYADRYCNNAVVIPTVVDTRKYVPGGDMRGERPPVVGWIGSPSTWVMVEPILPTLLSELAKYGATLRVIGAGPRAQGIIGVDTREWSEEREVADVQGMDIGVMPVPDTPFARGKCGYKLIQYMACGLPVVASPVGVNCEIVDHGENGLLATTPSDWSGALRMLLESARLRREMGERGCERTAARYSLASQEPRLLALLRSACEHPETSGRIRTSAR
jgi:hypothetical protein